MKTYVVLFAAAMTILTPALADESPAAPAAASTEDKQAKALRYFGDLPLVNQDGKEVHFYTDVLKDKTILIQFIYTHCEDACPLLAKKLSDVQDLLGEKMGKEVFFVSISIDPEHDDPPALKRFGERFKAGPGWTFLTGKKENIDYVVKKLGQYTEDVQDHSTALIAGNVKTSHWKKLRPDIPVAIIAEQLRSLAVEG